jgi:hypothetical protein
VGLTDTVRWSVPLARYSVSMTVVGLPPMRCPATALLKLAPVLLVSTAFFFSDGRKTRVPPLAVGNAR